MTDSLPLWSWINVIEGYRRFWYLEEILLNILLFMPFWVLHKAITGIKWFQGLLIGCAIGAGMAGIVMKSIKSREKSGL